MLKRLNSSDLGHVFLCCFCVVASFTLVGRFGVAADVKVETLLTDLHAPRAVVVRPDASGSPMEVFVAENGAGRIVSWSAAEKNGADEAISGLPTGGLSAKTENAESGVRALFFLDHNRLAAAGGEDDHTPFLWLFDLSDADASLKAEGRKQEVATPESKEAPKATAYVALTRTLTNDRVADLVYAVGAGDDHSDGLWKIPIHANTLGESALPVTNAAAPKMTATGGIAVSREGYIVVACQSGEDSSDSCTLKYLSPLDSRRVLEVPTNLRHITALAFSPKSGNLFAANSARGADGGGIYRIDDASQSGQAASEAVRIAPADKPSALAFGANGTLFVTALGESNGDNKAGVLLKLSGDL